MTATASGITIRAVEGREMLDILFRLDRYAFGPTPPLGDRPDFEQRVLAREGPAYYAVFEGDEGVAVACCPRLTQNVRGGIFKMAGYASISTHPKARRRGYARELMRYCHVRNREEGRVVSCLYPFRESFYERMGYVTFPQQWQAVFKADALIPLLKADLGGEFELTLTGDGYPAYRRFTEEMQPHVHGMGLFETPQAESAKEDRAWILQAKAGGRVEGVMVYTIRGNEMMNYTLQASRFYYRTAQARYMLLEWLARHVDQAGNARVWVLPTEHPNTWYPDLRPSLEQAFVSPMGRVLDVTGIGGMEASEGTFTAEIADPDCPWNNGVWTFDGAGGRLRVRQGGTPGCRLSIQGLSALVYGVNGPEEFGVRGWGDPPPEAAAAMRTVFPARVPYLHEQY